MPRNKPVAKSYTSDDVVQGVAAVETGSMTYREASERFKIPISSLCDRVKRRAPLVPCKTGKALSLYLTLFFEYTNYTVFFKDYSFKISYCN